MQQQVYDLLQIQRLLWPSNSPDLNPIECAWPYMKRMTTKFGAPRTWAQAIQGWESCWKEISQEAIQRWIERIPRHVQKVIW